MKRLRSIGWQTRTLWLVGTGLASTFAGVLVDEVQRWGFVIGLACWALAAIGAAWHFLRHRPAGDYSEQQETLMSDNEPPRIQVNSYGQTGGQTAYKITNNAPVPELRRGRESDWREVGNGVLQKDVEVRLVHAGGRARVTAEGEELLKLGFYTDGPIQTGEMGGGGKAVYGDIFTPANVTGILVQCRPGGSLGRISAEFR